MFKVSLDITKSIDVGFHSLLMLCWIVVCDIMKPQIISLTGMHAIIASLSAICMGWLRLVGSFKLSVSFAEYRLFCRALLH